MTQAITQAAIEATKAAIMAVREMEIPVNTARPVPAMPKTSGTLLRQPMLDWKSPDMYLEFLNLRSK